MNQKKEKKGISANNEAIANIQKKGEEEKKSREHCST
jgi:hypothetical protein